MARIVPWPSGPCPAALHWFGAIDPPAGRVSHRRNGGTGENGACEKPTVPPYVYVVAAVTVAVGWFCAVTVSVPPLGNVAGVVYVIDTDPLLSAPKREALVAWLFRVLTVVWPLRILTAVALPPATAVLCRVRSMNTPGTVSNGGSFAITVNVPDWPRVSEPVVAIGDALNV